MPGPGVVSACAVMSAGCANAMQRRKWRGRYRGASSRGRGRCTLQPRCVSPRTPAARDDALAREAYALASPPAPGWRQPWQRRSCQLAPALLGQRRDDRWPGPSGPCSPDQPMDSTDRRLWIACSGWIRHGGAPAGCGRDRADLRSRDRQHLAARLSGAIPRALPSRRLRAGRWLSRPGSGPGVLGSRAGEATQGRARPSRLVRPRPHLTESGGGCRRRPC